MAGCRKLLKDCFQYVKLVLPHVGLVTVVAVYAVIGAFIFYMVESPHEDEVRFAGIKEVTRVREMVLGRMWNSSRSGHETVSREEWLVETSKSLDRYTATLYNAFKNDFVSYSNVKAAPLVSATEGAAASALAPLRKEKIWTTPSSIFFAATTMATIGYGNIVPVTSSGRIICVFFALLGAPLAIITIGDLGKFLSECTTWLYKQLTKCRDEFNERFRRSPPEDAEIAVAKETTESGRSEAASSSMDIDDFMDKNQVPVLMVFSILLIYIALGAILFSFMENWSYVDSFYFCFITLTTVGFGDLVPEQHQFIIIMLLYIGVGLAVTTMCIDLVGIQYIQKIHYFGRKFRGADLLQMLKRKRMIERHLAMAHGEELLQAYLERIGNPGAVARLQDTGEDRLPVESPAPSEDYLTPKSGGWEVDNVFTYEIENEINEKTELSISTPMSTCPSERQRNVMYFDPFGSIPTASPSGPDVSLHCSLSTEPSVYERHVMFNDALTSSRPASWIESGPDISLSCSLSTSPSVYERQLIYGDDFQQPKRSSWTDSGPDISLSCSLSTSPSVHERYLMYDDDLWNTERSSWTDSGPDVSLDCSLTTSPSVYEREVLYGTEDFRSPSASSFKFEWPIDMAAIAKAAREFRRLHSCPEHIVPLSLNSVRFIADSLLNENPPLYFISEAKLLCFCGEVVVEIVSSKYTKIAKTVSAPVCVNGPYLALKLQACNFIMDCVVAEHVTMYVQNLPVGEQTNNGGIPSEMATSLLHENPVLITIVRSNPIVDAAAYKAELVRLQMDTATQSILIQQSSSEMMSSKVVVEVIVEESNFCELLKSELSDVVLAKFCTCDLITYNLAITDGFVNQSLLLQVATSQSLPDTSSCALLAEIWTADTYGPRLAIFHVKSIVVHSSSLIPLLCCLKDYFVPGPAIKCAQSILAITEEVSEINTNEIYEIPIRVFTVTSTETSGCKWETFKYHTADKIVIETIHTYLSNVQEIVSEKILAETTAHVVPLIILVAKSVDLKMDCHIIRSSTDCQIVKTTAQPVSCSDSFEVIFVISEMIVSEKRLEILHVTSDPVALNALGEAALMKPIQNQNFIEDCIVCNAMEHKQTTLDTFPKFKHNVMAEILDSHTIYPQIHLCGSEVLPTSQLVLSDYNFTPALFTPLLNVSQCVADTDFNSIVKSVVSSLHVYMCQVTFIETA